MSVRRQGYEFEFRDLGNLPLVRVNQLSVRRQSVLVGADIQDGFGVLTKSLYTEPDEFLVIEYVGSTPGGFEANELKGGDWGPRGFVNIILDDTAYFQTLDGRDYDGVSGICAPYPLSLDYQVAYKTFIPIEVPSGTWWDIRYIAYNRVIDVPLNFVPDTDADWDNPTEIYDYTNP